MIPNCKDVVDRCRQQHPQDWLDAHTGNANTEGFIRKLVPMLRAIDSKFGLNGKRGNPNDISDDAVNYLCEASESEGRTPSGAPCVVIDVIFAAGAKPPYSPSNPAPDVSWNVFNTKVEGSGANVDPSNAPQPGPTPQPVTIPSYGELGDDAFFRSAIGVPLQADATHAGETLNDGSSVWFSRATYRLLTAIIKHKLGIGPAPDPAAEVKVVRQEWRAVMKANHPGLEFPPL